MPKTSYTPGPWSQHRHDTRAIIGQFGEKIAQTLTIKITASEAEEQANARLIASAPELLEALEEARAALGYVGGNVQDLDEHPGMKGRPTSYHDEIRIAWVKASTAILKATEPQS